MKQSINKSLKKTNISVYGIYVATHSEFYTIHSQDIETEYSEYKKQYNINEKDMRLLIYSKAGCIIYYGSTIDENYNIEKLIELTGHAIKELKYSEYQIYKNRVYIEDYVDNEKTEEMASIIRQQIMEDRKIFRSSTLDRKKEIKNWIKKNKYKDLEKYICHRIKGQDNVKKVVASVYNYLRCISTDQRPETNTIIAAPSGCGKTETFRALRDYFKKEIPDLPIYQIDLTSITTEGFKGRDTDEIIKNLLMVDQPDGIGIVFLDELDKKLLPENTSEGMNVNASVQSQILTLIEGRQVEKYIKEMQSNVFIDTSKTMFIGLGSFNSCREEKEVEDKAIGFGSIAKQYNHYEYITRENMIESGGSYEFLGRFPIIVNYDKLTDDVIDQIIDSNIRKIEKHINYKIELSDKKRQDLHIKANGKYGCRLIYNEIYDQIINAYSELMAENAGYDSYILTLNSDMTVSVEKNNNERKNKNTKIKPKHPLEIGFQDNQKEGETEQEFEMLYT